VINDADLVGFAVSEATRGNNSGRPRLRTEIILQADALLAEGSRADVVAQFGGQRVVGLRHASLEQLDAVLLADGRLHHVALARLELQDARQRFPVRSQTRGRAPQFHVPTCSIYQSR